METVLHVTCIQVVCHRPLSRPLELAHMLPARTRAVSFLCRACYAWVSAAALQAVLNSVVHPKQRRLQQDWLLAFRLSSAAQCGLLPLPLPACSTQACKLSGRLARCGLLTGSV